ncbi:hypothetical protein DFH27DRAFT_610004 [Peziza echinospora]|nr:hypothetical protein DFH27DRAFT_610004 [Peziza echinospora]
MSSAEGRADGGGGSPWCREDWGGLGPDWGPPEQRRTSAYGVPLALAWGIWGLEIPAAQVLCLSASHSPYRQPYRPTDHHTAAVLPLLCWSRPRPPYQLAPSPPSQPQSIITTTTTATSSTSTPVSAPHSTSGLGTLQTLLYFSTV